MFMYDAILVPTDGSEAARRAASEAIDLASTFDATLHVVYVIDESAGNLLLSTSMAKSIDSMTKQGREAVAAVEEMGDAADVAVATKVARGMQIHETIVEYARENDVGLIVMGTSGRRGVEHLLGSTTERVLSIAEVPVLSVGVSRDDVESAPDETV
jgi:nucleotide-binding universal stress UspA family protein